MVSVVVSSTPLSSDCWCCGMMTRFALPLKRVTLSFGPILLCCQLCFSGCKTAPTAVQTDQQSSSLEGHALGEPIGAFIASSPDLKRVISACKDSVSADCSMASRLESPVYSGVFHCQAGAETMDVCHGQRGVFIFRDGKLSAIEFIEANTWDRALDALVSKHGRASETHVGTGETAGAREAVWSTPTSRLSLNGFEGDPSGEPTVCVILQTPEHYAKAARQQQESQTIHDKVLTHYVETEQTLRNTEAELATDKQTHASAQVISADEMAIRADEGAIKTYQLLSANEVRAEESREALY